MAFDVISSLELDKELLQEKFILVTENSGCESSFIHSCLIGKQLKDNSTVCLVNIHNDFNHFHNVGLKLGYNLNNLRESGLVANIDFLSIVAESIDDPDQLDLQKLFIKIKDSVLMINHASVVVIIDDITHFLHMNFSVNSVMKFINQCYNFIVCENNYCLIIGTHIISSSVSDDTLIMSNLLSYMADLVVDVSSLKTGRSVDVSGSFKISRPWSQNQFTNSSNLTKLDRYLYKLFDRGIKVFAPGFK